MAARLSGRPAPKKKSEDGQSEDGVPQASNSKEKGNNGILIAILAVTLVAALAAIFVVYKVMQPPQTVIDGPERVFQPGPTMEVGEFIVNLGNVNERRFLRSSITLEFHVNDAAYTEATEEGKKKWSEQFIKSLESKKPMFKDAIVTILSKKTAEELGTPRGKEEMKADLMARLNEFLAKSTPVREIYLTDFIVQ